MMSTMTGLPHAISFEREVRYPRRHARRDACTGCRYWAEKVIRPDNTRYDAGDHRPYAFDRSLWRGRTREYRAHTRNIAPGRVSASSAWHSHHLIHEYRGDRYDDHDDVNVFPLMFLSGRSFFSRLSQMHNLCRSSRSSFRSPMRISRAATSRPSARCGRTSNFKGYLHTLRFRDRSVVKQRLLAFESCDGNDS